MRGLAAVNLGIRFVLELCAYAALGYWGWTVNIAAAVLAPLAAMLVWWRFAAPKAPVTKTTRMAASLLVFVLAAVALAAAGQSWLGFGLVLLVVGNSAALRVLPDALTR